MKLLCRETRKICFSVKILCFFLSAYKDNKPLCGARKRWWLLVSVVKKKNPSYDCCRTNNNKIKTISRRKKKNRRTFFLRCCWHVVKGKMRKISFFSTNINKRWERMKTSNLIQTIRRRETSNKTQKEKSWKKFPHIFNYKSRALGGILRGSSESLLVLGEKKASLTAE